MPLLGVAAADPGEVDHQRRTFEDTAAQILPQRNEILEKFNELVDRFNDHWTGPVGWWRRSVSSKDEHEEGKRAIEQVRIDLEETPFPEETGGGSILDVADRVINKHTPVLSLFLTSIDWVDKSESPTSDVSADIFAPADGRNLEDWDDKARNAYNDIVAQQKESTTAAKDVASFMSAWLAGIADDNVGYVVFLLNQLAKIANKIISALVALADSFGVFTLLELAELVGQFVEDAINVLGETARRISSALVRVIDAEGVLNDHSFFPDGKWPVAVDRP
jgi:hypothetical protein